MNPPIPMENIQKAIRREFSRSELHSLALSTCVSISKGPKGGIRFDCRLCKKPYAAKFIDVDHIESVVPIGVRGTDMPIQLFLDRTFCDISNLQCLCKVCHKEKTKYENEQRKKMRKIKDIMSQLPDSISFAEAEKLYNSLPSLLDKVSGKAIGLIVRKGISWYKLIKTERNK